MEALRANFDKVSWIFALDVIVVQLHFITVFKSFKKNIQIRVLSLIMIGLQFLILPVIFPQPNELLNKRLLMATVTYCLSNIIAILLSFFQAYRILKKFEAFHVNVYWSIGKLCFSALLMCLPFVIAGQSLWSIVPGTIGLAAYLTSLNKFNVYRFSFNVSLGLSAVQHGPSSTGQWNEADKLKFHSFMDGIMGIGIAFLVAQQFLTLLMSGYWIGDLCVPLKLLEADVDVEHEERGLDLARAESDLPDAESAHTGFGTGSEMRRLESNSQE